MSQTNKSKWAGPIGLVRLLAEGWALLGGLVLLAVVLMQTLSVVTGIFGLPLPGDFELTEMGIAIAAFAFLPYCQTTGANVTADIFTSGLSRRTIAILGLLASLIALAFSGVLAWRMWLGMGNQFLYDYQTAILGLPIGAAYFPIIISLVLLALASLVTLVEGMEQATQSVEDRV